MADFAVGDFQLPADFEQQIASQLANASPNFAVQPSAGQTVEPPKEVDNFSVRTPPPVTYDPAAVQASLPKPPPVETGGIVKPLFDVNAYISANPDLAANWQSGGVMRGLGSDLASAAQEHYNRTGQFEIAAGGRGGAPAYDPNFTVSRKTGAVSERGMGENPDLGVAPPGVSYNPAGLKEPAVPTVTTTSAAPFDYSKLKAGEPQLMPASGQYATPYYAAYTNDGDLAGAVMVAPGQKIRIRDPMDGNVIWEGEGPEGAKQAVAIANSLSQEKGRKAAWQIQAEDANGGYTTQAAERYDPKKPSLIGKLATIALPLVLGAVFPPLAGLGSALTGATGLAGTMANAAALNAIAGTGVGLAKGQSLGDALKGGLQQGAISGLGAGVISSLPAGVQNVLSKPQQWLTKGVNTVVNNVPGLQTGLTTINNGLNTAIDATGRVTQPVFSTGSKVLNTVNRLNPLSIVGNALHPAATVAPSGSVPAGSVSEVVVPGIPNVGLTGGGLSSAAAALMGGMNRASFPEIAPDGSVDTVEVFKPDVPDLGLPFNPFPGGGTQVSEAESIGKRDTAVPGIPGGGGTPPSGTGDTGTSTPPKTEPPKTEPPKTTPPDQPIIPLLPIDLQPNDNGKGYSFAVGPGTPGTRGSLGSVYSAKLPAPWERYAARRPNDMSGTDWKRYGMGPERSFFGVVPQSTPVSDLSGGRSSSGAASEYPAFAVVQNRLAADSGRGPAPEGKRYIQRDDGVILLVDDSPEATYTGRSGATKKVRDLSVYQGGFTTKPISDFAAANLPEVIANLRKVGGLPMRRGGFAVQGDGDGREDAIPARLSDGEYVIDAETVALLGNGSSKAGAAKLDKFRVNVRKHKGRELAKGKFSASAKDPTAYLAGGRS